MNIKNNESKDVASKDYLEKHTISDNNANKDAEMNKQSDKAETNKIADDEQIKYGESSSEQKDIDIVSMKEVIDEKTKRSENDSETLTESNLNGKELDLPKGEDKKHNNKKSHDEFSQDNKSTKDSIDTNESSKKFKSEDVSKKITLSTAEKLKLTNKYKFNDITSDRFFNAFFTVLLSNVTGSDFDKIARISRDLVAGIVKIDKLNNNTFIRSKIWNLQDKNNVHAMNLYEDKILALEYLNLTNEEMKSKILKSKEQKIIHDSLMDSQFAKIQAETDIFRCGKCKNRKTTYHQLQTRSADEPMTTFVTCVVCNNRWKF